ncbi:hypothetical protein ACT3SP_14125 [Brachybacterium sp. AOP43-C2-M15]|uniref:hypothetical protein n=1 Tax=Brachybacterium sp. AOP43-C2-M15 TaxID=3457661 RepID=UPI004034A217
MSLPIEPKKLSKKLSDGLHGKLEFDFANERGHSFGEHYMHGALNEILASNIDHHKWALEPNYAAPELQGDGANAGRKRELDFAVTTKVAGEHRSSINYTDREIAIAIEAKWAASTHCNDENILSDLCRLSLIAAGERPVACLFVLAGPKSSVKNILRQGLLGPRGAKNQRLLHAPPRDSASHFSLTTTGGQHGLLNAKQVERLANKLPSMPPKVSTRPSMPGQLDTPNWSVFAWNVFAPGKDSHSRDMAAK